MKQLLFILFLFVCGYSVNAQVFTARQIKLMVGSITTEKHVMVSRTEGGVYHGKYYDVTIPDFADILEPYLDGLGHVATVYINGGDSLVIVTTAGDTVFFAAPPSGGDSLDIENVTDSNVKVRLLQGSTPLDSVYINTAGQPTTIQSIVIEGDSLCVNYTYFEGGTYNLGKECVLKSDLADTDWLKLDGVSIPNHTDSIKHDGYILLEGSSGAVPTKIEFLKEGVLRFDKTGSTATESFIQVLPMQSGVGMPDFGLVSTLSDNAFGTRKNDTYAWGINPRHLYPGPALYHSWEGHYQTTAVDGYFEHRLMMRDSNGVDYRLWEWYLHKKNPQLWVLSYQVPKWEIRPPNNDVDPYVQFICNSTGSISTLKLLNSVSLDYYSIYADTDNEKLHFAAAGMTTPELIIPFNVAIGLSDPEQLLHVGNVSSISAQFDGNIGVGAAPKSSRNINTNSINFDASGTAVYLDEGSGLRIHGDGGHYLNLTEGASTVRTQLGIGSGLHSYFNTGGNVIIGGTVPAQKLHVQGTARITGSDGTATAPAGRDADGDVSAMTEGFGINYTGGAIEADTTQIATQYDLTQVGGSSSPVTISPAQIIADQDNYNPTGFGIASYVILSSNNIWAITSFVDSTGGVHRKTLINGGDSTIILLSEHPDGTASNRLTALSSDFKLYPGKSVDIFYDGSRWRVLGAEDESGRTGVFYEWSPGSLTAGDNNEIGILNMNGANATLASTLTLPAADQMSSGTSSSGVSAALYFAKTVVTYSAFGSAHNYTEALISIPTLSDGTQTFIAELQLHTSPTSTNLEDNNIVGIRYSHGIAGGDFELFSQDNAGSESVDDLDVAVAAATLYKLRIEHNKANTEARAYINDAYVGRVTANLPNAVVLGARVVLSKTLGTTARALNAHSLSAGAIYK